MEAFKKLLEDTGEPAMLEICYTFMTLATVRPTEDQRALLEAKFAQDRHYENLRALQSASDRCRECSAVFADYGKLGCDTEHCLHEQRVKNSEAIQKIVNFFGAEPVQPVLTTIVESKEDRPRAPKPPKGVERYWPASRAKRFAAAVGAKGRLNHVEALEFLCKQACLTQEQLLKTNPLDCCTTRHLLNYRCLLGRKTYNDMWQMRRYDTYVATQ